MEKHGRSIRLAMAVAILGVSLISALTAQPPSASATGMSIIPHGTKELAVMNSTVAHTEGPASNYFNPALLPQLPGTHIETNLRAVQFFS